MSGNTFGFAKIKGADPLEQYTSFQLSEPLTANDIVKANTDGTIRGILPDLWSASSIFQNAQCYQMRVTALTDNMIVIVWIDAGNSYGKAVVGTITGLTFSWGAVSAFTASSTNYSYVARVTDTTFVIGYMSGSNTYGIVGTVSGTSLSWGTPSICRASSSNYIRAEPLTSSSVVIMSQTYTSANAIVGTVSGTSLSWGTNNAWWSSASGLPDMVILSSTSLVVAIKDASAVAGKLIAGTISGTTISFGSPLTFVGSDPSIIHLSRVTNAKFILIYMATNVYCNLYTVVNTTATLRESAVFAPSGMTSFGSIVRVVRISDTSVVMIFQNVNDISESFGTVADYSVTWGIMKSMGIYMAEGTNDACRLMATKMVYIYGESNQGKAIVRGIEPITIPIFGILQESGGIFSRKRVARVGQPSIAQSSLVMGTRYYYNNTTIPCRGVTTTPTTAEAGQALNSKTLLLLNKGS